jgi:hypothetical protein
MHVTELLADPHDAVPWLEWFRQAHPDITVIAPSAGDPFWDAYRDGERLTSAYFLTQLRDQLSWLLANEEPQS